jgi:hypothetical protein
MIRSAARLGLAVLATCAFSVAARAQFRPSGDRRPLTVDR